MLKQLTLLAAAIQGVSSLMELPYEFTDPTGDFKMNWVSLRRHEPKPCREISSIHNINAIFSPN